MFLDIKYVHKIYSLTPKSFFNLYLRYCLSFRGVLFFKTIQVDNILRILVGQEIYCTPPHTVLIGLPLFAPTCVSLFLIVLWLSSYQTVMVLWRLSIWPTFQSKTSFVPSFPISYVCLSCSLKFFLYLFNYLSFL